MAQCTNMVEYAFPSRTTSIASDLGTVFIFDDSLGTYADETADANNATTADITYQGALNDIWYFGKGNPYCGLSFTHSIAGVAGVLAWEYSQGAGVWATLTTATAIAGDINLRASGSAVAWNPPSDWADDTVNAVTRKWIRVRVTTAYTTTPTGSQIFLGQHHDFDSITLNIPENTTRTFRSVFAEFTARDACTVAQSPQMVHMGAKLGAAAWTDTRVVDTITNSGEHQSYRFMLDLTSYFQTNFGAATSETCQLRLGTLAAVNETQGSWNNLTARLYITYEYDDAAQTTRVKTVRIPLESPTAALSAVLTEIGTNQVPNLDSFLPEASKSYKDIFFEFSANDASGAVTDFNLALALDAEAEVQTGSLEQALTSATFFRYIWKRTDMTTNAAHAFKARSTVATRFSFPTIVLVVTYEYDHSASTSLMNSIIIPWDLAGVIPGSAAGPKRFERTFFIQEPTTITLAQSGILYSFNANTSANPVIAVGDQADRTYTHSLGSLACGQYCLMHRIDSGAATGAGITIARGLNTIVIDVFASTANIHSNASGLIYLNYTSGKHASGSGVHAHTTFWFGQGYTADTRVHELTAFAPNIPETNWHAVATGFVCSIISQAAADMGIVVEAEVKAGEESEDGWMPLYQDSYESAAENAVTTIYVRAREQFKRYTGDPDTDRLEMETTRQYRVYAGVAPWLSGFYMLLTYHAITYTFSGNVTGSGGGTVNIDIYRSDTDEKVGSTSRVGNGSYSFTWYDDTINLFAEAREDATHLGRSDNALAS